MLPHRLSIAVVVLATAAAACSSAGTVAAPAAGPAVPAVAAAAAGAPVPESLEIVRRIAAPPERAVPNLAGRSAADARDQVAALGIPLTVIKMAPRARTVTSQWPAAGSAAGADGVIVWLGKPQAVPTPRPAPVAAAPSERPKPAATGGLVPAPSPKPSPEVSAQTGPVPTTSSGQPVTSPVSGSTPGLEDFVAPPHGPRANIRTIAPAPAGQVLAGRASWYGPGFDGHQTACGGTFSASGLTLASRELRCGTVVSVSGPAGTVRATVTDWGPAEWTQRRFDLSQATFQSVASLGSGVIDVTVTVAD